MQTNSSATQHAHSRAYTSPGQDLINGRPLEVRRSGTGVITQAFWPLGLCLPSPESVEK